MSTDPTPVVPVANWNLNIDKGDGVSLFGTRYIFDRVDSDNAITFRAPYGANYGDFTVRGADGHPRKPSFDDIAVMWREGNLTFDAKTLASDVRDLVRQQGLDVAQARREDKKSQFRMAIVRLYDENPWPLSDASLRLFQKQALTDPEIKAMPGAKIHAGNTVREWINTRGIPGCRRECDGISMTGRMARKLKVKHPIEIVMYWAVRTVAVHGDCTKNWERYKTDLTKINDGLPLSRSFWLDPDGQAASGDRPAEYAKPTIDYRPMDYTTFWRLCNSLKNDQAFQTRFTPQARYQRYGGGGVSDLPTHVGSIVWLDETPVPKKFFVDDETGIPIGPCTLTLVIEPVSRVIVGSDLCPGAANASSIMRAILNTNEPKYVPPELLEIDPSLPWLRCKPTIVGLDNTTAGHGRTVEDNLKEHNIALKWAGSEMPRDKALIERTIGTILDLLFKQMPDADYDIALMRKFSFDPEKETLCSLQTARRLLATAIMIYNITRHRGLDNRQPALVWRQKTSKRLLNKIEDVEKFRNSIGEVEFGITMTNAGVERFNRRFTPGSADMRRILQEFERGENTPGKGIQRPTGKKTRPDDKNKRLSFKVKCKHDVEDLGVIKVFNPYSQPAGWEIFHCTDPNMVGTPLWLHERCLELAALEAYDYNTPDQQAFVRAKLFEEIANVDARAAERERRAMAKALDNPNTRRVMARLVEVVNEPELTLDTDSFPEPPAVPHGTSTATSKDAHIPTPRGKSKPPAEPTRMRRAKSPPAAPEPPPASARSSAKTSRNTNASRDQSAAPSQSANGPDLRPRRRKTMRYGDMF